MGRDGSRPGNRAEITPYALISMCFERPGDLLGPLAGTQSLVVVYLLD